MAIGKRIKFFRNRKGLTQKQFGEALGFMGKTSDVRLAQYEAEARIPKNDLVESMADILDVSPQAMQVPDIDSYIGLMHTLFTLEDTYGVQVTKLDGEICMRINVRQSKDAARLHEMICDWHAMYARVESGEITKEQYDEWRYKYPRLDTSHKWADVMPEELSDALIRSMKRE
ncbi:MAG: helix-turn-helix transcriptional regulator [Eubacteriales bacterium]|nr:helix-turn-helix transcriptional regulator [Eubacteriales bacterium]